MGTINKLITGRILLRKFCFNFTEWFIFACVSIYWLTQECDFNEISELNQNYL